MAGAPEHPDRKRGGRRVIFPEKHFPAVLNTRMRPDKRSETQLGKIVQRNLVVNHAEAQILRARGYAPIRIAPGTPLFRVLSSAQRQQEFYYIPNRRKKGKRPKPA